MIRTPRRFVSASFLWRTLLVAILASQLLGQVALATVSTTGNTTAGAPSVGGPLAGAFNVGNTGLGTLSISGSPGTPLTTSGVVTIGVTSTGQGVVTLNGLDSNWTASSFFHVGDAGSATVTVSNQAKLITTQNTTLADNADSFGQVTVTGAGSSWDSATDNLIIGSEGSGILEILAGARVLSAANEIGDLALGNGRVKVSGSQSLWRTTGNLFVGQDGRGLLQIHDGGRVENTLSEIANGANSIGAVEVDGFGSLWDSNLAVEVGVAGNGALSIRNGGRVTNTDGVVGKLANAVGAVEIRGAGSAWNNSATLIVGDAGRGTMTIAEGARVTSTISRIADEAGSFGEVVVDGAGSQWNVTGALFIADPGEAYVTVSNGGTIIATGDIGIGSAGRFTISNARVESATGFINNGIVLGNGTIDAPVNNATLASEIRIGAEQKLLITGAMSNTGLIDVLDGELEVLGNTTNVNNGLITARNSTLRFRGTSSPALTNNGSIGISFGTTDVFGDISNTSTHIINVSGGAQATFYDDLAQNGIFQVAKVGNTTSSAVIFGNFSGSGGFTGGGDVFALGDLRPGQSPAQVTMGGNLFLGGSTDTFIELGGTTAGQFDQLLVTGSLNLDGTLTASLIDGFTLSASQQFLIASIAGTRTGTFTGLAQGALVGNLSGRDLFISYTAGDGNDVALFTSSAALQGDFNNDGIVNALDYTVWRNNLNNPTEADINNAGDGFNGVDEADFTIWKQNYGNGGPGAGGVSTNPIPEPNTFALMIAAAMGAMIVRRSR